MRAYHTYYIYTRRNACLLQWYLAAWVGRQLEIFGLPMYTNGSDYTHVAAAPVQHTTLACRHINPTLTAVVLLRSQALYMGCKQAFNGGCRCSLDVNNCSLWFQYDIHLGM